MRILTATFVFGLALSTAALSAQPRSLAELERTVWEAIHAAQLPRAADAFREALRLAPRGARLMLGAGLTAYLLGRTEEARQHLTEALQAQPTLKEASILLGQLLHRSGRTCLRSCPSNDLKHDVHDHTTSGSLSAEEISV